MNTNNAPHNIVMLSDNVTLQDGRIVDIATKEGADAFLRETSNCDFICSSMKKIKKIGRKKRLNPNDKYLLTEIWKSVSTLGFRADCDLFREKIPEASIRIWLACVIEDIKKQTTNRTWRESGSFDSALGSIALFSCFSMFHHHAVPVAFAFESEFFSVLADFVKACKGISGRGLPSTMIAKWITAIVQESLWTSMHQFDNPYSAEKAFKKLEASGILSEYLRCMTVPNQDLVGSSSDSVTSLLKVLVYCPSILEKKFKKGEPCGDVVLAILEGKDGHRNTPVAVTKQLKGLAQYLQTIGKSERNAMTHNVCTHCRQLGRFDAPLMQCSRCEFFAYCSKECQRADWKSHKKTCMPTSKTARRRSNLAVEMSARFLRQNYSSVKSTIMKECQRKGLKPQNMAIELDFMPNSNGVIPAMSDDSANSFKITPIQEIINAPGPKYLNDHMIHALEERDSGKTNFPFQSLFILHRFAGVVGCHQLGLKLQHVDLQIDQPN